MPYLLPLTLGLIGLFFFYRGWRQGFFYYAGELISLALALYLALEYGDKVGALIAERISWLKPYQDGLGLVLTWLSLDFGLNQLLRVVNHFIPRQLTKALPWRLAGGAASLLKATIYFSVILTLALELPVNWPFKDKLAADPSLTAITQLTNQAEQLVLNRYGDKLDSALAVLTGLSQRSDSKLEIVEEKKLLEFKATNLVSVPTDVTALLNSTNAARQAAGLSPLALDNAYSAVARAHAEDMLKNGYFAHTNLSGQSPFDRIKASGLTYQVAGENLAFAPNVNLAHQGLMNSPKHRDNILYPEFSHLGIGAVEAYPYGRMYVELFYD